ncbi:MAG: DNA repair protein RecN [Chloroflexota bacterium]
MPSQRPQALLTELSVRNVAVIASTRLELGPGLNVITGETGAGKSLLVDALELVLGGRAGRELLRAGAERAGAEAVFHLPPADPAWAAALEPLGIEVDEDGVLALARELSADGRTVARVNGRTVPVGTLRAVGALLVDIHGQGEHLSLLDARTQLALLDAAGGLDALNTRVAEAVRAVRAAREALAGHEDAARQAAQQADLLTLQVNEIDAAQVQPGEEAVLAQERAVLASAQEVGEACAAAYEALYAGGQNAADLIGEALHALRRVPDPTGALARHADALEAASAGVEEAAHELHAHADGLEADPRRLEAIEERIGVLRALKRRYGGSEEAVLAFAERARAGLEAAGDAGALHERLEREAARVAQHAGLLASQLYSARAAAARALETHVAAELADLGMGRVRFAVALSQRDDPAGLPCPDGRTLAYGSRGVDDAEFRVETNPGEGMRALARVASGGETARLMLALKGALAAGGGVPTLVFDEVDAGVGARAGTVVGRKLWTLGREAQVLCVTHLAQIAAFADRHYRVAKATDGGRTVSGAEALDAEGRRAEVAALLGGGSASLEGAARELLAEAAALKGRD